MRHRPIRAGVMARGAGTWIKSPGTMAVAGSGGVPFRSVSCGRGRKWGKARGSTEYGGNGILIETPGCARVPEKAQEWEATQATGRKAK
ncbi:hypothetical protein BO94DRAFT_71688 [Aspergillus sclerotioniger CBS 115572]|uniref:Uncharacterized protein n=1 Tax=Aspergillus sclerotioniger CBS 115572 TaxID=1450535 RepID=A0A317WQ21_9EURO|nr:hypothetical protein BO94DRAFT_71688 [Aspergillus sclerotioniger CBS 115572]PWY87227.1 hypothetical protein BO94DRAFT_71688 [Aspergillus sclerotioniger CBS 115572]